MNCTSAEPDSDMHRIVLSVIVPMYNCESFIVRCLDSIDYYDSELLVVDDGSTDRSADVVSQYAQTHSNVKLIRKFNGGVSSARNAGLVASAGKYVMFVDADDYLLPGGLCRIINIAERHNADIVKYRISDAAPDSAIECHSLQDFQISERIIEGRAEALRRYDVSDYHVVDAVFRHSVLSGHNIRFDEDLHFREDDAFMGKFYCYASKVVCVNLPMYQYVRSSPCSTTHNQSKERNRLLIQSGLLAIKRRSQFIRKTLPGMEFPYEPLKYMRWVCSPRQAVEAGYSLRDYRAKLDEFHQSGVWPVSYKWIKVAGYDYSFKIYAKKIITTFLLNHPLLSYPIARLRY